MSVRIPAGGLREATGLSIEHLRPQDLADWTALRCLLWPEGSAQERQAEAEALLQRASRAAIYLARSPVSETIGFAEATLRSDLVNGCSTSPVAFLEGLYVQPAWRRRGVARRLCSAVEQWAAALGCTEFASDTELANLASQQLHVALGFHETERVVCYLRRIAPSHAGLTTAARAPAAFPPGAAGGDDG